MLPVILILGLLGMFLWIWGLTLIVRSAIAARAGARRAMLISGVVTVLMGIACNFASWLAARWMLPENANREELGPLHAASSVILLVAFFMVVWAWRGDASRGRRRCPRCWYDMSGSKLLCPECGHEVAKERHLFRTRRYRRMFVTGLLLVVLAYGLWITPRVQRGGPVAAIPSLVMIAGLPWLPDTWILESDPNNLHEQDWSLRRRRIDERLWPWERWLVHHRARGAVSVDMNPRALIRVSAFLDNADSDLATTAMLAAVRALASLDSTRRREGAAAIDGVYRAFCETDIVLGDRRLAFRNGLLEALDDPDHEVRAHAAGQLSVIAASSHEAVPKVLETLRSNKSPAALDYDLTYSLRFFARDSAEARSSLLRASDDPDKRVRIACARAFDIYGINDPRVATRLIEMLRDHDASVSNAAAVSLGRVASDSPVAIAAVFAMLERQSSGERSFHVLEEFRVPAAEIVQELIQLAEDGNPSDRESLVYLLREWAYAKKDLTVAVSFLRSIVASESGDEADEAAIVLDRIEVQSGVCTQP